MLKAAGLSPATSYNRSEVCSIPHISERTFWRYVTHHEITEAGLAVNLDNTGA